ncbi:MAG: TraR/DksA family transcriptional regulator [Chitinophagaceae bacterium]|nr:TraR/DksA family transcriptional regulator [Chitinophagaceae bacterium]
MATKKKQAAKKAAKPAPKKKPVAKKTATKKTVKKTKPVPKKAAPKKAAKPAPKKPVAKAPAKPVVKAVAKPEPVKPVVKKPGTADPKSLVSIKQKVKPVIKKEPPKPLKVVIPKTTTKSSVKYEPEFTKSVLDASLTQFSSGPTMRYSDTDLAEFREIIQKKLDAAKKELNYLQGLITRKDEGGDMDEARYMTMEDGSVSMEREQLSQMASRQITFIDHLEKAMMRIENKTYGICRVTGKLIDKARLRAVPHATLSIEAKQMMSK